MGTNYNPCAVTDGLKLYLDAQNVNSYPGTGTTWYDISGNSNHATFVNSPVYYANPTANMTFNGTNAYMTIARSSSMSPTAGISQEVWFKYDSALTNIHFIGLQYGSSYGNSYGIWSETTNLIAGVNISGTLNYFSSSVSFVLNTWYHCVHTYDGSIQKLYLNGNLLNSLATSGSIAYDSNNTLVTIGSDFQGAGYNSGVSWFLNGKLAQVRIYDRALSSDEVNQNYNSTKKRYSPDENIVTNGLVFNSDSGRPSSYPGTGTAIYDLSGSGYTGTLTNGPAFSSLNGGLISFDGSNDYINISSTNMLTFGTNPFTIDFWIYTTSGSGIRTILSNYSDYNTDYSTYFYMGIYTYEVLSMTNKVLLLDSTGNFINNSFGADITTNQWTHVAFTRSGNDLNCYKNGVLVSSATKSNNFSGSRASKIGGGVASIAAFPGYLPSTKIYNRALTAQEVLQNYNAIKNRYGLS